MNLRHHFHQLSAVRSSVASGRLDRLVGFGSNPGNLNAWAYVPEREGVEQLPLVVVLHGCTQSASGYDQGSGWSELAASYGFAVLLPEQQRSNNPSLCFNWFEPGDTRRGVGEALSIVQMIDSMKDRQDIDPQRVYITGLSAGGAMTSVMLALYPDLFAGGAILAGLPHGAAKSVPEALQQMKSHTPSVNSSAGSIRMASQHGGPWPSISVWHGTADTVVSPSNSDAIARQWKEVHGISGSPDEDGQVEGHPHRAWRDGSGKLLVEEYRVTGMGHGAPLATIGECGCGQAGSFMLEVGISSTVRSAQSWGLLSKRRDAGTDKHQVAPPAGQIEETGSPLESASPRAGAPKTITQVIEDALRAAGLMK